MAESIATKMKLGKALTSEELKVLYSRPSPPPVAKKVVTDSALINEVFGSSIDSYKDIEELPSNTLPRLARKGKSITLAGEKIQVFVNLKKKPGLMMVRCVFRDGANLVKIFDVNDLSQAKHSVPAVLKDNKLHLDLANETQAKIEDILLDFTKVFEMANAIEYFYFDLDEFTINNLLDFAVRNQESDRLRVVPMDGKEVLCLFNKNWQTWVKSVEELRAAEAKEESLGKNIQAAIDSGAITSTLDIRIYSEDPVVLADIVAARQAVIEQITAEREKLEHLLLPGENEVIRVILIKAERRKYSSRAFYSADQFRDSSFKYTDAQYCGDKGAISLVRRSNKSKSAYHFSKQGKLTLERESMISELRHHIHYRIWDSKKRAELRACGNGLKKGIAEFIDELKFIYRDPQARGNRFGSWGSLFRNDQSIIPRVQLFEWDNPYGSGHPLVEDTIDRLRELIISKGVHQSTKAEQILQEIDQALVQFFIKTEVRPVPPLFDLAKVLVSNQIKPRNRCISGAKGPFADSSAKIRAPLGSLKQIMISNPAIIGKYLVPLFDRLGKNLSSTMLRKYAGQLRKDPTEATLNDIIARELSVDLNLLQQIALDYYDVYEFEYALRKGFINKTHRPNREVYARLRENLLKSPLAYQSHNGKYYPTQLAYLLDMEVLEELVDQAINRIGL
ncbi:MAG: hypothetical protein ABIH69_07825 [bacterium]